MRRAIDFILYATAIVRPNLCGHLKRIDTLRRRPHARPRAAGVPGDALSKRHGELIRDLAPEWDRLCELQVVGTRAVPPADFAAACSERGLRCANTASVLKKILLQS